MENHIIPITMTKKIWNVVRAIFLIARKRISSKSKLLLDLNRLLKQGKIAGKAVVRNLNFHRQRYPLAPSGTLSNGAEYEFSCSNTPAHQAMFNILHHHHKMRNKNDEVDVAAAGGMEYPDLFLDEESYEAVSRVLDTIEKGGQGSEATSYSSRVTDSPFMLANKKNDGHVDQAAEEFINRFYSQLRQQRLTPDPHGTRLLAE